jgi:hypothetical protein
MRRNMWVQLHSFWTATAETTMNSCTISSQNIRFGSRATHHGAGDKLKNSRWQLFNKDIQQPYWITKLMASDFGKRKAFLIGFLPRRETINAYVYQATLIGYGVMSKTADVSCWLVESVNTRPHIAENTPKLFKTFHCKNLEYHPLQILICILRMSMFPPKWNNIWMRERWQVSGRSIHQLVKWLT